MESKRRTKSISQEKSDKVRKDGFDFQHTGQTYLKMTTRARAIGLSKGHPTVIRLLKIRLRSSKLIANNASECNPHPWTSLFTLALFAG